MKSFSILVVFLFLLNISFNANAVNLNGAFVESESTKAYSQWRNDFYWSLVKNNSLKLKVAGIILLYNHDYHNRSQLKPSLDKVLKLNLNKEMYYHLRGVCGRYSSIKPVCDDNDFYARLIANDSENLNLYIMDLDFANYNKNHLKVTQLLKNISKSTFSNTYTGFALLEIKAELIKFTDNYPIPSHDLSVELSNSEIELLPEEKQNVLINNEALTLYSSGSNYSTFAQNCQSLKTKLICTHVIDILMNHSNSPNDQHDAYRIQADIAISDHNFTDFKKAVVISIRQRFKSSCKNKLTSGTSHNKNIFYRYAKLHPLYRNTIIQNLSKYSYEAYDIAARKLVKYLIENNLVYSSLSNNCKDLTIFTDEEVFEKYQDDKRFNYDINRYDKKMKGNNSNLKKNRIKNTSK